VDGTVFGGVWWICDAFQRILPAYSELYNGDNGLGF
jgi:hypothetical protein